MNTTDLIAIIDTSGSMQRIMPAAQRGFHEFLDEQRRLPGETMLSMYEFSGQVRYSGRHNLKELRNKNFACRGMTALNDAIGQAITVGKEKIPAGHQVIVVILTDGEENSSVQFSRQDVSRLIEEQQDAGWTFVFLAANQDAFKTAAQYSIKSTYVSNFDYSDAGATQAMQTISAITRTLRGTTY